MKFGKAVVKARVPIVIVSLLLAALSVLGMLGTRINYDMLTYLPKDMETSVGQQVLLDDFGKGAFSFVLVEDMPDKDVSALKEKLAQVDHVESVIWYDSFADISVPKELLPDKLYNAFNSGDTTMLAVFFVISGANLRLSVFSQGVLVFIGVVYIIARSAGKYCGARWSAKAVGCDHTVQKYLGIMLLPQEGVALGMCVSAQALGADGELIRNIILFSVLIYELVGPVATKESLKAAGAITEKPREVLERRERKLAEAEPKELLERHKERANKK